MENREKSRSDEILMKEVFSKVGIFMTTTLQGKNNDERGVEKYVTL